MYGTRVIIAEDTLRLAQNEVEVRELDLITVAGKAEAVRIHELLSPFNKLPRTMPNCARDSPAASPPTASATGTRRSGGSISV